MVKYRNQMSIHHIYLRVVCTFEYNYFVLLIAFKKLVALES